MRPRFSAALAATLLLATFLAGNLPAQDTAPPPPPPGSDVTPPEGVDVQARGPVHEAYAEPTDVRPMPSPLVTQQPPDPVNEVPPDQRPEGDNVIWVPGYWAWDPDASNYLWVSGVWRTPPPGRQWVPGAWQQVEGGWHWVAGFWAPAQQAQLQYLPPPPPSLDQGPAGPAPNPTSSYVPGCWVYRATRYVWRPGFWVNYQPGWVWIPANYVWTPAGYVFVEGYWDHPLEARGLLFAPVRIARRLLRAARWSYVPQFVVQPDFLLTALFVRPAYSSYYFGDYFQKRYTTAGFIPWVDYRLGRSAYDPNFAYYRHAYAGRTGWVRNLQRLYADRFSGAVPRPPHTLVQQTKVVRDITAGRTHNTAVSKNLNITHLQNVSALAPVRQVHNLRVTHLATLGGGAPPRTAPPAHVIKLQPIPREQRTRLETHATQLRKVAAQRRDVEARMLSQGTRPTRVTDRPQAARLELPRAPVHSAAPARPQTRPAQPAPAVRTPPTAPQLPRHEERAIPRHEPPRMPTPPRKK